MLSRRSLEQGRKTRPGACADPPTSRVETQYWSCSGVHDRVAWWPRSKRSSPFLWIDAPLETSSNAARVGSEASRILAALSSGKLVRNGLEPIRFRVTGVLSQAYPRLHRDPRVRNVQRRFRTLIGRRRNANSGLRILAALVQVHQADTASRTAAQQGQRPRPGLDVMARGSMARHPPAEGGHPTIRIAVEKHRDLPVAAGVGGVDSPQGSDPARSTFERPGSSCATAQRTARRRHRPASTAMGCMSARRDPPSTA